MLERIRNALGRCGISLWRINETEEETAELFFVGRELDTRRVKNVQKYEVTVFRDVEAGRGFTAVQLIASMEDGEIERELRDAYYAAQFAANPSYELTDPVQAPLRAKAGELAQAPLAQSAGRMVRALFAPDTREDAFVNSAELFAVRKRVHILSSEGTDVAYTDANVNGEFVVQCREPEDVEIHNTYSYNELDEKAQIGRAHV